jgi:hypothetical protein
VVVGVEAYLQLLEAAAELLQLLEEALPTLLQAAMPEQLSISALASTSLQ